MNIICEILIEFIKKIFNCFIPERDESALVYVYKENEDIDIDIENESLQMDNYSEFIENKKYYSCYQSPQ